MQQLTVEYLKRLGACWPISKLEQAARSWPTPVTWAWFLGDRLHGFERSEIMLRVHCALAHVMLQRLRLPISPGQFAAFCKEVGDEQQLLAVLEKLGALLDLEVDAPGHQVAFEALEEAINTADVTADPPTP